MAGQVGERLGPVGDHLVRAGDVEAAFLAGNGGEPGVRLGLPLDTHAISGKEPPANERDGDSPDHCGSDSHRFPLYDVFSLWSLVL